MMRVGIPRGLLYYAVLPDVEGLFEVWGQR